MPEIKKGCDRSAKVDRAKIDKEKRTVELSFASETPVERWGENEVLSHDKGDYDFSRIASGTHPLLLGHEEYDPTSQIGVVESARVDADKVSRAVVRFGNSPLANEIFQDVQDGIRQLISVGYDRTSIASSEKSADGMVTTRYRWMPTHIAVVPVPADTKVGVGREREVDSQNVDVESIAKNLTPEQRENMKRSLLLLDPAPAITAPAGGGAAAPALDENKIRSGAQELERSRVRGITKVADELSKDHPQCAEKIRSITSESIEKGDSLGDYQIRAMREVIGAKPVKPVLMADLGMDENDQRTYSILRGIQSCIKRNTNTPDGLEGEVHTEIVKRGGTFEGFAVPANANVRCRADRRTLKRDLQAGVFAQGGAMVPTILLTSVIELLRNRMVTSELGIQTMGGLSGNVSIPRQTGAATAYSLPESATLTKSTQALDQILLAPHRVGAWNDYTKQLLLQSSIDVENFIRDDLMKVIAIKWDALIIYGQGAGSEPQGIVNTPGIASVNFGAAATFAKLVAFETALAVLNADDGAMAYATTPSVRGVLKSAAKLLTGATTVAATPLWENGSAPGEGIVNGYRALASNQIQNNQVIFGNWSDVIHGLYGGYDVIVNPYSRDTDAAVRITINTFGDVAVRHAASFCASSDAGNQ
jgi:HK97 family phage major capsid protein